MQVKRLPLSKLGATLRKDLATLHKRTIRAAQGAAEDGRGPVRQNAPEAFGEIKSGVIAEKLSDGSRIRSSAPHSAAVEEGSRPHMPPIAPILAWVRLRGMQGLTPGPHPAAAGGGPSPHPEHVAASIAAHGNGSSTPVDAAHRVAWAIALKIAKHGTKPTFWVAKTLPEIESILDKHMKSSLSQPL